MLAKLNVLALAVIDPELLQYRSFRRFLKDRKEKMVQTLKDEGSIDFALLFCEPHNAPFYERRGWKPFEGEIYAEQADGRARFTAIAPHVYDLKRAPRRGTIDLCGRPW